MTARLRALAAALLAMVMSSTWAPRVAFAEEPATVEVMQLSLDLSTRRARPGDEVRGTVWLRAADGHEARAPRSMVVRVESALEGQAPTVSEVTIAEGQSRAAFGVRGSRPGMLRVRATNPELREAGAWVNCVDPAMLSTDVATDPGAQSSPNNNGGTGRIERGQKRDTRASNRGEGIGLGDPHTIGHGAGSAKDKSQRAPTATPSTTPPPPPPTLPVAERDPSRPTNPTPSANSPATSPAPQQRPASETGSIGTTSQKSDDPSIPPGPPPHPTRTPGRPLLSLRLSPQRPVLADGKDALSVLAFLDRAAPTDMRLTVFSTSGKLEPRPLVIPRGASDAAATLTGQDPGDVMVELLSTDPVADVDGDRKLKARFAAPVSSLRVEAEPGYITLVETGKITVRLYDAEGRSVATDAPRTVDLTLDRGHGAITAERIVIPAGMSEASTTFEPTWPGPAGVSATSTSLFRQSASLRVTWPFGLLLLSLAGGLVGGTLAMLRVRKQHVQRVLTGGVTGFVLYWAFVVGLLPLLRRTMLLNPLSVFALSTVGGWMGTEVFAFALRKLGIVETGAEPRTQEDATDKDKAKPEQDKAQDQDAAEHAEVEKGRKGRRKRAAGG